MNVGNNHKQVRKAGWLSLATVLVSALGLASLTLGGDETPRPAKEAARSSLAAAEMIVRGPDEAVVGQRFTIEVLVLNSGTTPLKDLTVLAKMDAVLEHESKTRAQRLAVDPVAPGDLQIVRLTLTPRKNGAGGVDLTLRAGNGETQEVRHVLPIVPEDSTARPGEGKGGLQIKITPFKECFADRPTVFLVHVLNADRKPMEAKRDLVVSYVTPGQGGAAAFQAMPERGESKRMMFQPAVAQSSPIRQIPLTIPALAAGEGRTFPVRIAPRRLGELQITVTAPFTPGTASPPHLGAARLMVKFDPQAPVEQMLPVSAVAAVPATLPRTLADVPEVSLENGPAVGAGEGFEHVAHLIEKIKHVNTTKTDAYVEALTQKRPDVGGLPFVMGHACRMPADRAQHFPTELNTLRVAMANPKALAHGLPNPAGQPNGAPAIQARIAAMVQVLGPEGTQLGQEMVKYLSTLAHVDATRALARLAIFSEDEKIRNDAVTALSVRREKDVTDFLVGGLNYPWPAVAQRAADAIVKLKRTDLIPQLVEVLERPDPRTPQTQEKDGKKVTVVREMVRINHLRNCLLCHSPASAEAAAAVPAVAPGVNVDELPVRRGKGMMLAANGGMTAPVPVPGQQLPTPSPTGGYGRFSVPELLVAIDVTYLRQDFSVKMAVAKAQPWPEQQRFDFLVRTREVTDKEAQAYRDVLKPAKEGDLSQYQQAAVASLRKMTGRDADPTAAAWRTVLAQK